MGQYSDRLPKRETSLNKGLGQLLTSFNAGRQQRVEDDKSAAQTEYYKSQAVKNDPVAVINALQPMLQQGGQAYLKGVGPNGPSIGMVTPIQQLQMQKMQQQLGQGQALPIGRQNQKDKRTEDLITTIETNNVKREMLSKAQKSLSKIPTGLLGSIKVKMLNSYDPNNPLLGDWQNVKAVLTDAQLMNTAKTKGAISDREMELFSKAAANDDVQSIARIKPVLEKLSKFMDAEEHSKMNSFKKIYGEDPSQWPELQQENDYSSIW